MVNFKTRLGISVILAAMLLSGCQTGNESSSISSAQSEESSSVTTESSGTSLGQSEESTSDTAENSDFSSEEEPPQSEFQFYAGRVYPDDELVPSEWIRVDSYEEVKEKIDEIVKSDTSAKDPEIALPALMNKGVLFFLIFYRARSLFDINWDAPYNFADFEKPIYPFTTEYFPDVQGIYDFAYQPYERSFVEEHFLLGTVDSPKKPFVEENGQMYINTSSFPTAGFGGAGPFIARTYAEIIEKTDNKCTFIWHYPDVEGANLPEDGYEFYYYEKTYTAEYIDGSWKLSSIVTNLGGPDAI